MLQTDEKTKLASLMPAPCAIPTAPTNTLKDARVDGAADYQIWAFVSIICRSKSRLLC